MLDIKETLFKFRGLKVLIIGDVMLDCYLHGRVDRISPEAQSQSSLYPIKYIDLEEQQMLL